VADWGTIAALASAGGTLVLAAATFGSTRSANRAARVAERSLVAGLQPLLIASRVEDAPQKISFADDEWLLVPGGAGAAEVSGDAVYLAISLRNVGTGIAVLHGWKFHPERSLGGTMSDLPDFTRLTRDLYVAAGETGFWQGTFRDPSAPEFVAAREAIERHGYLSVEILYGNFEGGQRMVSRFQLAPATSGGWIASVNQHWNVDQPNPR
jgi:hypothetical protein